MEFPHSPNAAAPGRPRKHHRIKCFLSQYERIQGGTQFAINRYLDPIRDFQVDDTLTLCEGYPDLSVDGGFHFSGRELSARISCIDTVGCLTGFGTLSLQNIGMLVVEENALSANTTEELYREWEDY